MYISRVEFNKNKIFMNDKFVNLETHKSDDNKIQSIEFY